MMKLNYEWFHTRSLIEDVNELVSTMAIAKRLELNYVVEQDVPAWVKGDKVRVRQILLNVIGNAIKFTSQGEVFSHCRVLPSDRLELNEMMLEFSIVDTGRGFTAKEAELIFKPFSQIDGSSTRQHGGSGLGLVISRQLVELHGGQMVGTAVPGQGSTFTFTAKFGLPTAEDHPEIPMSPKAVPATVTPYSEDFSNRQHFKFPASKLLRQTISPTVSPTTTDASIHSPAMASIASSGSSDPSIRSGHTRTTERSSMSSVNTGLTRFSEAARASGQDLSQMKLEMPSGRNSPGTTPTVDNPRPVIGGNDFRPPMYSILVLSPQAHSREATVKHIEMTLPKDVPYQITAKSTASEAKDVVGGSDPVTFTHVVINLLDATEVIDLVSQLEESNQLSTTNILILTDSVQRQQLVTLTAERQAGGMFSEKRNITYINKPVKPSRFAVIFDPAKERDLSIDRNRSTAQRIVESQKQSYLDMQARLGNKGFKVLLVEDNLVNQKVLQKYMRKVGVEVDAAIDGVECTEKVFSKEHGYYSLILVRNTCSPTDSKRGH
jgi:CheY-like chemotaxis protein